MQILGFFLFFFNYDLNWIGKENINSQGQWKPISEDSLPEVLTLSLFPKGFVILTSDSHSISVQIQFRSALQNGLCLNDFL